MRNDISKYIKDIQDFQNLDNTKIIPLNIFQTWSTLDLPPLMKENVELLKQQNPEFNYYLYDDNMCREFIKNNYEKDVLYTYDKLKPGAFKADLFRYCILYKYGGIYLDIKYKCVNQFKLIYLTNSEYFVRDHEICENKCSGTHGIYQALLICLPNNSILLKCINGVVENVKNNYWTYYNSNIGNPLSISGPLFMNKFFYEYEINKFDLNFDKTKEFINFKDIHILEVYNGYRKEQKNYSSKNHYHFLFKKVDIYNYIKLENTELIDFSRKIIKNINNKEITFYSSSPSIINVPNEPNTYIINIRWVNYTFDEYNIINPDLDIISLNSRFKINKDLQKISDEIFLEEIYDKNIKYEGIEDIRLFNMNNIIYYIGTCYNKNLDLMSITCDLYKYNESSFIINENIINPDFYNLDKIKRLEKNWSLLNYNGEFAVIYSWSPILIGKIDFDNKIMNIVKIKYDTPDYFKDAKGTSTGYIFNNEIWFVLHKSQKNEFLNKHYINYQHFFAIFDLDMNLLRYSELFKLEDASVEFCLGIIVEKERVLLSYSIMDNSTKIGIYSLDYINNNILWYNN